MRPIIKLIKLVLHALLPASLYHSIKRRYRIARTHFEPRLIRRTYCGHELSLKIGDVNSADWYDRDYIGDEFMTELPLLRQHGIRPGATVFDIGAHQCVVGCLFSREVGPQGRVVAVEGDPFSAEAGRENARLNEAANLIVVNAIAAAQAAADGGAKADSERVLEWSGVGAGVTTVDLLAEQHGMPDFMYVDVDGFECEVLRGATKVLAGNANWFVEIHIDCGLEKEGGSLAEVLRFFPQDRYRLMISGPHECEFVPYAPDSVLLTRRFFLLALRA